MVRRPSDDFYRAILLFALSMLVTVATFVQQTDATAATAARAGLERGKAEIQTQTGAVDFNFTDFDGKARKLSDFQGKVVLLDFWATWCSPCIGDFPHLKELYAKHKSSGFEIIGLDCETLGDDAADADTIKAGFEQAKSIIARFGTSWTMAEPRSAVTIAGKHFQVESLPTKILIDRQGKIVKTVKSRAELEESLVQSLKQQ
jgi:thiol-disulfide isomerase/thioredoxin